MQQKTLTKKEAVEQFVARDMNAVPQSWVEIIAKHEDNYYPLPMWGTMWIVDGWIGEKLLAHSRVMVESTSEIDLESIEDETERQKIAEAIEKEDWPTLEDYIDEEMAGANCVLDQEGRTTALFVYEIADEYVIGVNGAGWDFYSGVWDKLYDLMGLQWHETE